MPAHDPDQPPSAPPPQPRPERGWQPEEPAVQPAPPPRPDEPDQHPPATSGGSQKLHQVSAPPQGGLRHLGAA
jgi:hypothetical protein